ncbi:hypothetical protein [Pseudomonas phage vB_PsaM_M1]|nr:hypothetical protein [Pseudomonas phage vB_PsaM_M1]
MKTYIEITGMGGIVSNEAMIIAEALREVGAIVTVKDDYVPEGRTEPWRYCLDMEIEIVVNHKPWGG